MIFCVRCESRVPPYSQMYKMGAGGYVCEGCYGAVYYDLLDDINRME